MSASRPFVSRRMGPKFENSLSFYILLLHIPEILDQLNEMFIKTFASKFEETPNIVINLRQRKYDAVKS